MPLNPPPTIQAGLALVTMKLIRSDMSRAAEVTFALNCSELVSPTMAQDVADDFQQNWVNHIDAIIDSEVTCGPAAVKIGDGTTVPTEATASGSNPGTYANTMAPPNVAMLVKKLTPFGGKKNRGRTFFPFSLASADVSENGTIAGAYVAIAQSALNAFLAQLATDLTPMCIANKTFNTPLPPHYVTAINKGPDVTALVVENMIATQRRRLGRG